MTDAFKMNIKENPSGVEQGILATLRKHSPKELGRWAIMTVKTEIALYDLRQSLYWQSLIELGMIAVCLFLLIFMGKFMVFVHLPHLVRPLLGYYIILYLPRLHSVYEGFPEDLQGSNEIMKDKIFEQFAKASRVISFYLIVTGVAAVLDTLGIVVDLTGLGGDANTSVFYAIIAWVFIAFDSYLFLWYYSMKFHFPHEIWVSFWSLITRNVDDAKMLVKGFMGPRR